MKLIHTFMDCGFQKHHTIKVSQTKDFKRMTSFLLKSRQKPSPHHKMQTSDYCVPGEGGAPLWGDEAVLGLDE